MSGASKKFNYLDNPPKTFAVQNIRVKQPCSSATSATMSQEITFNLPNNVARTVMDSNNLAIKFKITNNDATANASLWLAPYNGAMSVIKKVDIISNSVAISSIDNYDKVSSMFMELEGSSDWLKSVGEPMLGATANTTIFQGGNKINSGGGSQTVVIPLPLTGITSLNHYLPMWNKDQLQIRILLNTTQLAFAGTAGMTDADVELSSIELVYNQLRMNDEMYSAVYGAVGGVFRMTGKCFASTQQSNASGSTTDTHTLSFNYSDLESVFVALYSETALGANTAYSQARSQANVSYVSLLIDGVQFPQRRIIASDKAENILALTKRRGVFNSYGAVAGNLVNFNTSIAFMLADGTGASDATSGQYAICVDLQQQHEAQGLNSLLSGLDTQGATVQAILEGAGVAKVMTVVYTAVYTQSLILDMSPEGGGMYSYRN